MSWQLQPARDHFPAFAPEWDRLNAELYGSHPMFDSRFVGPGEKLTRIADAARLAKDGDTIEILPGEYRGDVAVWQQKQLTIRGLGQC